MKNLNDSPIAVKMALQLVLLVDVDEKAQILHTNVWLTLVIFVYPPRQHNDSQNNFRNG